jgi:three-Cys-motif partner protein
MGVLWSLEPATAAKHQLYRQYLDAWWPIMLQPSRRGRQRPRVTYLDAFAGPGRYLGGEEGSPVFVLGRLLEHTAISRMFLSRERVCLVFIEKGRARYEHLLRELIGRFGPLDRLPVRVDVRHGEAARDTQKALTEVGAWGHPILGIFDSWGNVNVPLSVVGKIARNRSSEVIMTFGPNWFSRREELDPEQFDAVFGGRAYWQAAERDGDPEDRWRAWLSTYREALARSGFPYRLHFQVVPRTGQPLYLVYGTCHEKGVQVMKDAMWAVDGNDGMTFRDPRTRGAVPAGQIALWAEEQNELLELVVQRLESGPITVEDLGRWLLLETARWRTRNAREAVQELVSDGTVKVESAGRRLTSKSVVKLR